MTNPIVIELYTEGPDGEASSLAVPAPEDIWADDARDAIARQLAGSDNPDPLATMLAAGILIELRRLDIEGAIPTTEEN